LIEGDYRVQVQLPRGIYVKSIQYEGTEVLNKPWQFRRSSGAASLEIVVRPGAAEIEGQVTDASAQPVAGASVILVPVNRHRLDLYSLVLSGPGGRFAFPAPVSPGLPPGEYRLFSLPALERYARFNPAFLDRFETLARRVQLTEGDKLQVDLRILPTP
jgi:hypothetical protein